MVKEVLFMTLRNQARRANVNQGFHDDDNFGSPIMTLDEIDTIEKAWADWVPSPIPDSLLRKLCANSIFITWMGEKS